jgi:DNA-binding response OmpR family regulator
VLLVVEDEPLVGLDIAETLTTSGASAMSAGKVADAIAAADRAEVSAAILDIRLGGEDCSPVCQHLSARGIPVPLLHRLQQRPRRVE